MWLDEVHTLWIAESGEYIEGPMYRTAPVNFWLTAASVRAFGSNELGERFPSFLAGVLTIALFIGAFRRPIGDRAAILGALFLCLSMWHVFWSQTGRHFGPQTLFILLGLASLFRFWRQGAWQYAWLAAGAVAIALATHSSTFFFVVAFVTVFSFGFMASLVGRAERPVRDYFTAGLPFLVLMLVYVPVLLNIGDYLLVMKEAWNPPYGILASYLFYVSPIAVFIVIGGFFVLLHRKDELAWLLAGLILIPFAMIVYSTTRTISSAAYILATIIPVAALIGVAADWLLSTSSREQLRWVGMAIVAGIFTYEAWNLAHYYFAYNGLKPRWKDAIEYVEAQRTSGEPLYASEGVVAEFYLGRDEAGWIGKDELAAAPEPGAWYIAYMSLGPMPDDRSLAFRTLLPVTRMMNVFPLQYGAKNRSLVVFYAQPNSESLTASP
jgi:4-amino-4-deoxy-L-arabinose transferase-like glycosyltransferase